METNGSPTMEKISAPAKQSCFSEHRPNDMQDISSLPNNQTQTNLEPYCFKVLTSQEISKLMTDMLVEVEKVQMPHDEFSVLVETIEVFKKRWHKTFSQFGSHLSGELAYRDHILYFYEQIIPKVKKWLSPDGKGQQAIDVIDATLSISPPTPKRLNRHLLTKKRLKAKPKVHWDAYYQCVDNVEEQAGFQRLQKLPQLLSILKLFHSPATLNDLSHRGAKLAMTEDELTQAVQKLMALKLLTENFQVPKFDRPIFIVSPPRAGSTLLFNTLSHFSDLWTTGEESHELIENIEGLHPSAHNFSSNRLTEVDATCEISALLKKRFTEELLDREGTTYLELPTKQRPHQIRFLEKTPKNALRIPFLKSVFPEALFIYLYREPRENISSMMEGWRSPNFPIAYRNLPGWPFKEWKFLLPPGWSSLQNCSLVEIAAYQWKSAHFYILEDIQTLPKSSWCLVRYSDLIEKPKETISQISQFAGLHWDHRVEQVVSQSLPISQMTLSTPSPDKWRKNEREIATVLPGLEPIVETLVHCQLSFDG